MHDKGVLHRDLKVRAPLVFVFSLPPLSRLSTVVNVNVNA